MNAKISEMLIKMTTIECLFPYGEIMTYVKYKKHKDIPTMGITITDKGILCYYNESFVNSLDDTELMFLMLHECFHIILRHIQRSVNLDPTLSNIATDAIINHTLTNNHNFNRYITFIKGGVELDRSYNGSLLFEEYYKWLLDNSIKLPMKSFSLKDNSDDNSSSTPSFNVDGVQVGIDVHLEDIVSEDVLENTINDIVGNIKQKGCLPSEIEKILNTKLTKQIDYLKVIKRTISNTLLHSKRTKSYMRPNRYGIEGLKGNLYKGFEINCILDTSGSMSGEFDKVLSFLYNNKVVVNLIQIDTKIHSIKRITNTKHIDKIQIKGLGGTELQPALDHIAKYKELNRHNTLILTDGYTDDLSVKNINKNILIISTETKCTIKEKTSKVTQIVIKNNE